MTDTPMTTTTDPSEMPTHLSEAAKQRSYRRILVTERVRRQRPELAI